MDSEKRHSSDAAELAVEEARPFLLEKEDEEAVPVERERRETASKGLSAKCWLAIIGNCVATAGIVFINKRIFQDAGLRHAQVAFAAFHFTVTATMLYIISRPQINMFQAKRIDPVKVLPLAMAMIFNVVLPNASLAYSSIQFYQIVRVLLTPGTALLNYVLYQKQIPRIAAMTLVPICVGVAIVSYFDTMPASSNDDDETQSTTPLGVVFALSGVLASSIYTVWIKTYHASTECSSMQLLLNQAPVSVVLMLYIIPLADDVTAFRSTEMGTWVLILLSGVFACVINLTQFVIINEAGPVSSTVVGHFKTCSIVAMGWVVSGKPVTDGSMLGIVLAVGGIVGYQHVTQKGG